MAQSNASLVEAFVNGASHGRANNMEIREGPITHNGTTYVREGETALVGYGWAIYAVRASGGRVNIFSGWHEWANNKDGQSGKTTLQHLSLVENKAGPTFIYTAKQAQCASPPKSADTMRSDRAAV